MLPLAHVLHQLIWALYAVPILIVAVAIVKSMIAQRRLGDDEEERV
jgi:heme exporter protein D